MYKLKEFFSRLDEIAPIEYSYKQIERGDYDNSGIIVNASDQVKKVLFTLDLSDLAVKKAKRLGVDTIVTHHPAIYAPIKTLDINAPETASLLTAVEEKMNVISMHLNLDVASGGIDACLSNALSAKEYKIIDYLTESVGYGREFKINKQTLSEYKKFVKKELKTDKIICYGKKTAVINKVASFCGGGGSHAVKAVKEGKTDADLIVTSDLPHHLIKELVERGKLVMIIPHYASEEIGFKRFCEKIKNIVNDKAEIFYFEDRRFR